MIILTKERQHKDLSIAHSPPFNQHVTYCLGEEGFARDLTNPCKVLALSTTIFTYSLSILTCLVPQVVTNLGPVT